MNYGIPSSYKNTIITIMLSRKPKIWAYLLLEQKQSISPFSLLLKYLVWDSRFSSVFLKALKITSCVKTKQKKKNTRHICSQFLRNCSFGTYPAYSAYGTSKTKYLHIFRMLVSKDISSGDLPISKNTRLQS